MARPARHNRAVSDHLHPLVYAAVAGFVLWYVVSAWIFFGDERYTELLLAVVTGFFFMAMAIPGAIWLVWRRYRTSDAGRAGNLSLPGSASGGREISQRRRRAPDAGIAIVPLLSAVA